MLLTFNSFHLCLSIRMYLESLKIAYGKVKLRSQYYLHHKVVINELIQEESLVYFWYIVRAQYQLAVPTIAIDITTTNEVGNSFLQNL